MSKQRYYLLEIKERTGEYEFHSDYLIQLDDTEDIEERVKTEMKDWRGESEKDEDSDWYSYYGGQLIARCHNYIEVPEEDYKVLNKYL